MNGKVKTYRVYNLLNKYFPFTTKLVDKRFDISTLDIEFEKLLVRDGHNQGSERATNIIDITLKCADNNPFHLQFAKYLDNSVKDDLIIIGNLNKKKLRENFKGKFTNFSTWNYLSPFGEAISLLSILGT
jgi:hypothetical protein